MQKKNSLYSSYGDYRSTQGSYNGSIFQIDLLASLKQFVTFTLLFNDFGIRKKEFIATGLVSYLSSFPHSTANMTNILTKLLIIINLLYSILCVDSDVTSSSSNNKFIATVNKVSSASQVANNRVSKLRLILLSDIKQNEIVSMFSTHLLLF